MKDILFMIGLVLIVVTVVVLTVSKIVEMVPTVVETVVSDSDKVIEEIPKPEKVEEIEVEVEQEQIRILPQDEIYVLRAKAKNLIGLWFYAKEDCDKALEINPNNTEAYIQKAISWYPISLTNRNNGFQVIPIGYCNDALRIDPEFSRAYLVRGIIKLEAEQWEDAESDFFLASFYAEKQKDSENYELAQIAIKSISDKKEGKKMVEEFMKEKKNR